MGQRGWRRGLVGSRCLGAGEGLGREALGVRWVTGGTGPDGQRCQASDLRIVVGAVQLKAYSLLDPWRARMHGAYAPCLLFD